MKNFYRSSLPKKENWLKMSSTSGVNYLWKIVMFFISCFDSYSDGTHSLQRIHCWASDVMLHFSKSDEETNSSKSWMAWGWAHFRFGVNYSFCIHGTFPMHKRFFILESFFRLYFIVWMKHSVTLLQTSLHSPQRKSYLHYLNISHPPLVLVLTWTRPSSNLSLDSDSTYSGLGLDSDPNDLVLTSTLAHSQPPALLSEASAGAVLSSVTAVRMSPQLSHLHQLLYQTERAVWPISSRAVSPVCYSTLVSLLAATQELILWFISR